jgi:hypothetical protein
LLSINKAIDRIINRNTCLEIRKSSHTASIAMSSRGQCHRDGRPPPTNQCQDTAKQESLISAITQLTSLLRRHIWDMYCMYLCAN